ncbi:sensor histidine kinase [Roseomonas nepalensis]|uniref:histidine kinase n=1 Tax=Muricoccus nepalensis TaxID=1854500 RepID=A0A502FD35_9PROT|nr:sensor histidine kinase [Roseomonas nepalensis]TPG47264.1 sensor histidine kinase [Roseomonas nepalensis]
MPDDSSTAGPAAPAAGRAGDPPPNSPSNPPPPGRPLAGAPRPGPAPRRGLVNTALLNNGLAAVLGGIRGRMIVLLMVAGIPVASIAITNALQDHRAALAEGRRGVESFRTLMAVRYGAALGAAESLLTALAREDPRATEEPAACNPALRRVIDLHPGDIAEIAVLVPDGPPLCGNLPTGFDPGPLLREALNEGSAAFGGFLPGTSARVPVLPVIVPGSGVVGTRAAGAEDRRAPARPPGASPWAVLGTVVLHDYVSLAGGRENGSLVWLVDRDGRVLSPGGGAATPLDPGVLERIDDDGQVLEGPRGHFAYAGARLGPGLRLVVGQPVGLVREAARTVLIQRIMELATFLVACLAAIVIGADLAMVRPLRLLSARVRGWRPGAAFRVSPAGTEPREVRAVEQAFSEAAAALARREGDLRAALEQRDALMGEIHHRVKNNLQIVSSLLNLQAGRIGDPAATAEFLAARNRVRALATLHRHLYMQHSFETVSLVPFLTELTNQQFSSHNESPGERLALRLEVADIAISTDQAVSLSLLVTEAVGNAVEHAFPDDTRGTIRLSLAEEGGEVTLVIADDGIGIPDRKERPRGLGLQLMEGFAKQLGGPLTGGRREAGEGGGTLWSVHFPVRENPAPRPMSG